MTVKMIAMSSSSAFVMNRFSDVCDSFPTILPVGTIAALQAERRVAIGG